MLQVNVCWSVCAGTEAPQCEGRRLRLRANVWQKETLWWRNSSRCKYVFLFINYYLFVNSISQRLVQLSLFDFSLVS